MSFFLAFVAFAALIVLHEFGHFAVAKAVGMRVERFALFFPPLIFKVKRGETEYGIGAVPLGGYVKITGMRRDENVAPEHLDRAYFNQKAWKRIAVIAAGPAMNVLIAIILVFALFRWVGISEPVTVVDSVEPAAAASGVIAPGDSIKAVNQVQGNTVAIVGELNKFRCEGRPIDGCKASRPVRVTVAGENGALRHVTLTPRYDADQKRMRLGIRFKSAQVTEPTGEAVESTFGALWGVTKRTIELPVRLFDEAKRKEIGSAVGGYETTRQAIKSDRTEQAVGIIALISLSLALINLFPFLPLDGGHIFWTLVEKIRGHPVPTAWLDRASVIGLALVLMLFMVGLTNDIDRFRNGGFGQP